MDYQPAILQQSQIKSWRGLDFAFRQDADGERGVVVVSCAIELLLVLLHRVARLLVLYTVVNFVVLVSDLLDLPSSTGLVQSAETSPPAAPFALFHDVGYFLEQNPVFSLNFCVLGFEHHPAFGVEVDHVSVALELAVLPGSGEVGKIPDALLAIDFVSLVFPEGDECVVIVGQVHSITTLIISSKQSASFLMKLYQFWPANQIFCLRGALRLGPLLDAPAYLYAQGMLITSLILFLVFVAGYLAREVSVALPIIISILFAITQGFVVAINCTDPGIIPPRNVIQKLSTLGFLDFRTIESLIGQSQGTKFCETCKISRPSRSAHCSRCGFCVEVMDHHCPFVNSCIGKRNYQFFTFFLISLNLYIVAMVTCLTIYFVAKFNALSSGFTVAVVVILAVLILPLLLILLGFFCCHLCLLIRGRTTRQMLKGQLSEQSGFNWFRLDPPLVDFQLQID